MSLPIYQYIHLKSAALEDLSHVFIRELNLKHPVAINLKNLTFDDQREAIVLIEHYFTSENLSFKFPYPIYLISEHQPSITKIPLLQEITQLPKFFSQRESRINVKESHLAGKNKLLQQEVKNSDASANNNDLENYGRSHRIIYELEQERKFYRSILNQLVMVNKDG